MFARNFAAGVRLERLDRNPLTRQLPRRQSGREVRFQGSDFDFLPRDDSHDLVLFPHARDVENNAFGDGGMSEQCLLDLIGRDFASGDVHDFGGAAAQEKDAVAEFHEVAGAE